MMAHRGERASGEANLTRCPTCTDLPVGDDVELSEKQQEPEQEAKSANESNPSNPSQNWPNRPHLKQITAGRQAPQSSCLLNLHHVESLRLRSHGGTAAVRSPLEAVSSVGISTTLVGDQPLGSPS
ncbi:unnamed protein product [Lampetra fluviatilis]